MPPNIFLDLKIILVLDYVYYYHFAILQNASHMQFSGMVNNYVIGEPDPLGFLADQADLFPGYDEQFGSIQLPKVEYLLILLPSHNFLQNVGV